MEARLRDCIRSLKEFNWPTSVNMIKFNDYCHRLRVKRDEFNRENVVIDLRGEPTAAPQVVGEVDVKVPRNKVSPDVIRACLVLAANSVCTLRLEQTTKAEVPAELLNGLDVGLVEKDGSLILL